jgi:hypothetical protein
MYAYLDTLPALQAQQIVLGQCTLVPRHPDRQWLTYLCIGTQHGHYQGFLLQRAIPVPSHALIPQEKHSQDVWVKIGVENLRLSSCI